MVVNLEIATVCFALAFGAREAKVYSLYRIYRGFASPPEGA